MVASINRLPPEILSHIFVMLVRASRYATSIGDKSYNGINYPLRLSRVCARWRRVATTTPMLWSFLDICRSEYTSRYIEYLNTCYERSGHTPLILRLGQKNSTYDLATVDKQLAPLLSSCAARLNSLVLAYSAAGFANEALSFLLVQKSAGQIRKLALSANRDEDLILTDNSLPQITIDRLLETLHSLYLDSVCFDWSTVCCQNLVELHLDGLDTITCPSSSQLVSFLNANPKIRKLNIGELDLPTYESSLPSIKLPELQNLELTPSQEFIEWFFALLTPGNHDMILHIDSYIFEPDKVQTSIAFQQFFQRARIVKLRIPGCTFIPFSSIAAYLPHLETLRTAQTGKDYDLSKVDSQTELLPKLHTVELTSCHNRNVRSGLWTILTLPSVRQILLTSFLFLNKKGDSNSTDIDQVRTWMHKQGITANVRIAPELRFDRSPSPFM